MFKLVSDYKPTGDQPQAIEYLSKGIKEGKKFQTLLGVTGFGKTFTMANIIQNVQKPTLVLAHNKTLAGQLYSEFKEFFPENNVEYFGSYYDYYQNKQTDSNTLLGNPLVASFNSALTFSPNKKIFSIFSSIRAYLLILFLFCNYNTTKSSISSNLSFKSDIGLIFIITKSP